MLQIWVIWCYRFGFTGLRDLDSMLVLELVFESHKPAVDIYCQSILTADLILSTSSFTFYSILFYSILFFSVHLYSSRLRRRFRRSILTAGNATLLFIRLDSMFREIWIHCFERFDSLVLQIWVLWCNTFVVLCWGGISI